MLEDGYTNIMNLFAQVKNLRNEDEDVAKQVKRLARHLNQDVTHLMEEIYGSDDTEMTQSVIKDLADQIGELTKRFTTLLNLSDKVEVTYGDSPFEMRFKTRKGIKKTYRKQCCKRHLRYFLK